MATKKLKPVVSEEVEQLKEEVVEVEQVAEVLKEAAAPFAMEVIVPIAPVPAAFKKEELSKEERIINFLESRNDGEFVINDFLKSLYPTPTYNMPAEYLRQGESKALKGLLTKMQAEGKISFVDNSFQKLGQFYYEGSDTQTKHYNILNVKILVKK